MWPCEWRDEATEDKDDAEDVALCKLCFLLREVLGGVLGNCKAEKSIAFGSNVPPGCCIKGENMGLCGVFDSPAPTLWWIDDPVFWPVFRLSCCCFDSWAWRYGKFFEVGLLFFLLVVVFPAAATKVDSGVVIPVLVALIPLKDGSVLANDR